LVKTVRYHGVRKRSPSGMPTFTGRELNCRGGSLSGEKVSAALDSSDFQSGGSQPSGGRKLGSGPSPMLPETSPEGDSSKLLDGQMDT
jgi:hypothetical protein